MTDAENRIKTITERWFLLEPLLFNVFCTHRIQKNDKLYMPFRTGNMVIEYSPDKIENLSDKALEEYLKVEVLRIVLKHPYERVPYDANKIALGMASDVTIEQTSKFSIPIYNHKELGLHEKLSFEEYYRELKYRPIAQIDYGRNNEADEDSSEQSEETDSNGKSTTSPQTRSEASNGIGELNSPRESKDNQRVSNQEQYRQLAELWGEDELAVETINSQIVKAQESNGWGTVSGDLKQMIEASLIIKMDYRKILTSFRASVLSQERELTRTRPNRRYGFDFMGSHYKFTTKLLIGVDVSGSITDESLSQFFSIINRFFKYGIKEIDVIQFDYNIKGSVLSLKKAKKQIKITGRGGTCFQPLIDYYASHYEYDGLIIFTDGCAEIPKLVAKRRILWILTDESSYNEAITWIKDLPNNRAVWIPSC